MEGSKREKKKFCGLWKTLGQSNVSLLQDFSEPLKCSAVLWTPKRGCSMLCSAIYLLTGIPPMFPHLTFCSWRFPMTNTSTSPFRKFGDRERPKPRHRTLFPTVDFFFGSSKCVWHTYASEITWERNEYLLCKAKCTKANNFLKTWKFLSHPLNHPNESIN